MKFKTKKFVYAALSLTMASTIAASQIITYANESKSVAGTSELVQEASFKNVTGSLDLSEIVKNNLSNQVVDYGEEEEVRNITGTNVTKTVMISLNTESISESKGSDMTVAEYLDTSAGQKALRRINESQSKLLTDIAASGIAYKEVARYNTLLNAVAIEINTAHFNKIRKMSGVSMAGISKTYSALSAVEVQENYSKIYGTGIYDTTSILDKYDGSGITVAILDTGLDYTHEAFSYDPEGEVAFDKEHIEKAFELGTLKAAQRSPGLTADDVYLSKKVPFVFDYADDDADVYPSYNQHGVHVAGIVAGKAKTYVDKDGNVVDDFSGHPEYPYAFLGAAPNAQLVICKTFTDDLDSEDLGGATSEDLVAALDDCATLGVDIVNMSLGTASGFYNIEIDGDDEGLMLSTCYKRLKGLGVSLIAAAGNEYSSGFGSEFGTNLASNPDSGTVGSPSTFTGSLSVASVNGQMAPYLVANADNGSSSQYANVAVFYNESNDANSVPFNFAEEMLDYKTTGKTEGKFTYLVIPGVGRPGDYSTTVKKRLASKQSGEKIIVVVRRGSINFQEKVENASALGADGIIVYNNVPGTIRMSLGEIEESKRIPAISIDMNTGSLLTADPNNPGRQRSEGKIEINITPGEAYEAGPFMNDYSSWGATPSLELKPDITSHGGEILSAVAGGYQEMSGTSMATPNLAGLMALVRAYVKDYLDENEPGYTNARLTQLCYQIVMSSATLLKDPNGLPYSPRKQGAGLATLDNIFGTQAYLYTKEGEKYAPEDDRPKIELRDDKEKKGEYEFTFYARNFGESTLTFNLVSHFFTETLASDGLAVAEQAHLLNGPVEFKVDGVSKSTVTLEAGASVPVTVKLKLSKDDIDYLKKFVNGMYVEGFISLESNTGEQCDLNLPFMGFYGDWTAAPMLDYNAYEVAEFEKDTSLSDAERPHESVYATQLFSTYYNGRYAVPMGGFAYLQDEDATQKIYTTEEYASISRYNEYYGATSMENYLTSTGLRALYAGLLRNAEIVTYDIYNEDTGEIIYSDAKYRIGKAYAMGGSPTPALVDMKLTPDELGLENNGKYRIEFKFYMDADDKGKEVSYKNTFSSTFYVDYDAPVLEQSRIRYYDYKDGNRIKQKVYLDLDIYDNHYPQAVLLCYEEEGADPDSDDPVTVNLATEYVTPVFNPVKNGTNTVSIEITDIVDKYKDKLYVQLDDYSLNHNVYQITWNETNSRLTESEFSFVLNDRVTKSTDNTGKVRYDLQLEVNEMYRVELDCGSANASNYEWSTTNGNRIALKKNEIFGLSAGQSGTANATVTVKDPKSGNTCVLNVTVVDKGRTLTNPTGLSFGPIEDAYKALKKASGTVEVNAGQRFALEVVVDPWYYTLSVKDLKYTWTSSNPEIAEVDENGNVHTFNKRGTTTIVAETRIPGTNSRFTATVILSVKDPFNIESMILNKYYGDEEIVYIPNDKNVMYIGEEAFKDNTTMKVVVLPKTLTEISERAFLNCTALEKIYLIDITEDNALPIADLAALHLINADAFMGCENLKELNLTNAKVVTIGARAFADCDKLEKIVYMEKIGTAYDGAFKGCTSLEEIDITGLHTASANVFEGCTGLETVKIGHYTALCEGMFYGCTNLQTVTIKAPRIGGSKRVYGIMGGGAFENCTSLTTVNFENDTKLNGGTWDSVFRINPYAFAGCSNLATVNFGDVSVSYIGDYAFSGTAITSFTMPSGDPVLGENIFGGKSVNITWANYTKESDGAIYKDTTLILAPATISSNFTPRTGTTEIAAYAFASSKFSNGATVTIPETVTFIGEGAFKGAGITSITIPSNVTEIAAYAFANTKLTSITINSNITSIGEGAFSGCSDLTNIDFAGTSTVNYIGDSAFSGTAITNIIVPQSVKTMGSRVFENCKQLTTATLTAVTELGEYTFFGCTALTTATFGDDATASGTYTFFPGTYFKNESGVLVQKYYDSSLTTVTLGDGITSIGEGVFWYCVNLASIDLNNVTEIGKGAFTECKILQTVTNLDKVVTIGDMAFAKTTITETNKSEYKHIADLNLASAKTIGEMAFFNMDSTTLSIPVAESIGAQAFAGIQIKTLTIPETLRKYGSGAFMSADKLATVAVKVGNDYFFANNNVLYRRLVVNNKITDKYELCLYPAGRVGTEYTVLDGTVSVQSWAFSYLNYNKDNASSGNWLATVTLPYSLKTIGVSAFYGSPSITRYNFQSIAAPTLLSEWWDLSVRNTVIDGYELSFDAFRTLFFNNFRQSILDYFSGMGGMAKSDITLAYPSNGTGYTNLPYRLFFDEKTVSLGELMEDDTREFNEIIDGIDLDDIRALASLNPKNESDKAKVEEISELIKYAHGIYNNKASRAKQRDFIGEDRYNTLVKIEEILKPIKETFGIPVNVALVSVDASSKHRSQYKTGETFDMKGLVLLVTYDDYSTEIVTDISGVTINSAYAGELSEDDKVVGLEYEGISFRVSITVSDSYNGGSGNNPSNDGKGKKGCGGCGSIDIGTTIGGMGLMLLTLTGAIVLAGKLRRKSNNQ